MSGLKIIKHTVNMTTHHHLMMTLRMHGAIPPSPQYIFIAWCLIKKRDNFTFHERLC